VHRRLFQCIRGYSGKLLKQNDSSFPKPKVAGSTPAGTASVFGISKRCTKAAVTAGLQIQMWLHVCATHIPKCATHGQRVEEGRVARVAPFSAPISRSALRSGGASAGLSERRSVRSGLRRPARSASDPIRWTTTEYYREGKSPVPLPRQRCPSHWSSPVNRRPVALTPCKTCEQPLARWSRFAQESSCTRRASSCRPGAHNSRARAWPARYRNRAEPRASGRHTRVKA